MGEVEHRTTNSALDAMIWRNEAKRNGEQITALYQPTTRFSAPLEPRSTRFSQKKPEPFPKFDSSAATSLLLPRAAKTRFERRGGSIT